MLSSVSRASLADSDKQKMIKLKFKKFELRGPVGYKRARN